MNSWMSTELSAWAPPLRTFSIGTGHPRGPGPAEIGVERQAGGIRRRLGDRQRHAQHGVGAEAALVRGAVEIDQGAIDAGLVARVHALQPRGDLVMDAG